MKAFVIPSIFTAIDKFSPPVKKMGDTVETFANRSERSFRKIGAVSMDVAKKSFLVGAAIALPLVLAANEAIKFEDKMADVAKTTGLAGKPLEAFGGELLAMAGDTRTSIEGLQKIAEIGGQMGVAGKELLPFTQAVDKFNVALGGDFAGGVDEAARAIGGLNTLFKETRSIPIAESITKAGSAINALSSKGVMVPELSEFLKRIGQLPDAIKPTIQDTAALGAVLNKVGITAEIGARAVGDILLTATQNAPAFAKQMGITERALADLLNKDPAAFLKKFSSGFAGMKAETLGPLLKKLKLGDSGSIKVIGALSTSTKMLTEFQALSNKEFADGTSIMNEFNVKNNTTAARLAKAKNNMQAFAIIIGTQLLPVVSDLLSAIMPVVSGIVKWAKENPALVKTIVTAAAAIAGFAFVLSGISFAVALVTKSIAAWGLITKAFTVVQWLMNGALLANPIGLIIIGILALIAVTTIIIQKYNEWGAALALIFPVFGMLINLVQAFRRNWEMITSAFKTGGVLEGFKAIGATILDSILMPLQQVAQIIADLTGSELAISAVKNIEAFRKGLGVNVETDESGESLKKGAINSTAAKQNSLEESIKTVSQNVKLLIENKTGHSASVQSDNNLVPVTLSSTLGF